MDYVNAFFDLKQGVRDTELADAMTTLFTSLRERGEIEWFRITRRKLGLGPPEIPEWHVTLAFRNLSQLDEAFATMSSREEPTESFHFAVNSRVSNLKLALYRDFPDPGRVRGQEKF